MKIVAKFIENLSSRALCINAKLGSQSFNFPSLFSNMVKLTRDWHYLMQYLSSIFCPERPIVLTRKPFAKWHLSAFVMFVCTFFPLAFLLTLSYSFFVLLLSISLDNLLPMRVSGRRTR